MTTLSGARTETIFRSYLVEITKSGMRGERRDEQADVLDAIFTTLTNFTMNDLELPKVPDQIERSLQKCEAMVLELKQVHGTSVSEIQRCGTHCTTTSISQTTPPTWFQQCSPRKLPSRYGCSTLFLAH